MGEFLGTKRVSIWLLFMSLALAASQMHPGFATLMALTALLLLLLAFRFVAHFEGQYMLKEAEAHGKTIIRPLARELAIGMGIGAAVVMAMVWVARHMPPWLWFAGSS